MVTRRGLLRAGLTGVAVGAVHRLPVLAWAGGGPTGSAGRRPVPLGAPGGAGTDAPLTCELTGFRRMSTDPSLRAPAWSTPLPRPPVLTGAALDLPIEPADVEVLPGRPTPMLTYAGTVPGPTILARPGQPLALTLHNGLDEPAVLHLHGVHAPAEHDGHVAHEVPAGGSRTYRYPNAQRPATLWYHDHVLMRTAERVHRGLAGAYLLADPAEAALGLPVADERDVVIVLADRAFAADGSLVHDPATHTPAVGDVVLVNGADRPRLDVGAGLLRLRVVNGSNARAFRLARGDGEPLVQVATDGGLLGAPASRSVVELWPAERAELLLDLTDAEVGTRVLLVDAATTDPLLAVDVVERARRTSRTRRPRRGAAGRAAPPDLALPAMPDLGPPEVVRTITLDAEGERFLLAGHGYDVERRDVFARFGAVERWRLVNTTTASHPMHLHLASFLVRGRTTASGGALALRPEDEGWKDTVLVRPFETVEVDVRFDDHLGDFLYHCHVLEHEDHDMMSQFRVVDVRRLAGASRVETAVRVAAAVEGPRRRVVVADGDDWRAALAGAALADALLLVSGDALHEAVAEELRREPPQEVVVVGTAVPDAVLVALADLAPTRRVAGGDPIATAAAVALDLAGTAPLAVVATDAVFADALAAGLLGVPVLLTDPTTLSPVTADALAAMQTAEVLIAGGPAAVGPAVEAALQAAGHATTRVAGDDRTATAAAFARRAGLADTVWAASATRFPDALGAAVAARRTGASLVLVGDAGASPATAEVMAEAGARRLTIAGGEVAVPLGAEADLAARLLL